MNKQNKDNRGIRENRSDTQTGQTERTEKTEQKVTSENTNLNIDIANMSDEELQQQAKELAKQILKE